MCALTQHHNITNTQLQTFTILFYWAWNCHKESWYFYAVNQNSVQDSLLDLEAACFSKGLSVLSFKIVALTWNYCLHIPVIMFYLQLSVCLGLTAVWIGGNGESPPAPSKPPLCWCTWAKHRVPVSSRGYLTSDLWRRGEFPHQTYHLLLLFVCALGNFLWLTRNSAQRRTVVSNYAHAITAA